MGVLVWLGPQKSGDDEVGVAGKGVRLLDGGGDRMEGVSSIDDEELLASLIVIGDSGSLDGRCSSSCLLGAAARDDGVLEHSFLVFSS